MPPLTQPITEPRALIDARALIVDPMRAARQPASVRTAAWRTIANAHGVRTRQIQPRNPALQEGSSRAPSEWEHDATIWSDLKRVIAEHGPVTTAIGSAVAYVAILLAVLAAGL